MTDQGHTQADIRRRRLLYRATHRGTHENEILIGGFVRETLSCLTEADMDVLEEILEFPDPALADWLTGRRPIPPEFDSPMLRRIKAAALKDSSTE